MVRCRVGVVVLFVLTAVHAGDELTEAARRERITRLRARAITWYSSRKRLLSKCGRCQGAGQSQDGLVTCSRCAGSGKAVLEEHYRTVFVDMMSPAYRAELEDLAIENEIYRVTNGGTPPAALNRWEIDRVELADATHGVVWARQNGEKTPVSMRWILVEENGKPEWFVYDAGADGSWPGGWKDGVATPGIEEIDWDEWSRRAREVRGRSMTSLAKVEALKAEAAKVLIVDTVKIVDVAPSGDGAKVVVCRLYGGPWRTALDVGKDDLPLVKDWGKWDRLTWRLRVVVEGALDSEVRGEILWDGPESIVWAKNPGLGGQEIDPAEPPSFREWCAKFDAAEAAARLEMIKKVQGKAFVDEAKVVERTPDEAKVQFEGGEPVTFPLHDPQAADEVQVGDTIVVARWADTMEVAKGDASREKLRFGYAVLKRTPAAE